MQGQRRVKSAEMEFRQRDHAWIGSWGEKNGRKVVIVTMIEHGGGGAKTAAPIARSIMEAALKLDPASNPPQNVKKNPAVRSI